MNFRTFKYKFSRKILRRSVLWADVPRYQLRMRVFTRDTVGRSLYLDGTWEDEIVQLLFQELSLKDGDIAFDVGANMGWYSLILDKLATGTSARIIAFEPGPQSFALLQENLQLNNVCSVTAVQKGLADVAGRMTLHLHDKDHGRHSLLPLHKRGGSIEVAITTLNDYWEKAELEKYNPKFIKIDIEGFELMALRGATHLLERCPLIMTEYSPKCIEEYNMKPQDIFELMATYNYTPHLLVDRALQKVAPTELLDSTAQENLFWRKQEEG